MRDMTKDYLFQKHIDAGLHLEDDEDSVVLSVKGGEIAHWNATKATIDEIRREADLALGITFAKES